MKETKTDVHYLDYHKGRIIPIAREYSVCVWGGEYQGMDGLQFNWIGFDQTIKYIIFECSKTTQSKPVKLETSHSVKLPPKVSVFSNCYPE